MTFQCFLSCLLLFLGFLFPFKPVVQTATHTRLPLNVAATNYLGEEGQGKSSTGWRKEAGVGGGIHIPALALKLETLCRKVNTGNGRRRVEQANGD